MQRRYYVMVQEEAAGDPPGKELLFGKGNDAL